MVTKQTDWNMHAGKDKAVYAYPMEHYNTGYQDLIGECSLRISLLNA